MRAGMALFLAATITPACDSAESASDAGAPDAPHSTPSDASASFDAGAQPDAGQAPAAMPSPGCANQRLDDYLFPAHGTVHGAKIDGRVCDNGLGTFFLGPEDTDLTPYDQHFFTTTVYDGAVPGGAAGAYGFFLAAPTEALSATLSGWTGASAPDVGSYDSATQCGWLDFEVTLPVPPGVECTSLLGAPCEPGCEGHGEAQVCVPAPARLHYLARSAATCESQQDPPAGEWTLTVTSVSPLAATEGYQHFQTHGQLTATLANRDDASDSVVLNLDF